MPMESHEGGRWPAPLAVRLTTDADAAQVANAMVALWLEIDQALHPVIGHRGVAALYNRSIKLTMVEYPWLAQGHQGVLAAVDPSALKAALLQQTAAQAAASGDALLQSFQDLLASLIGASLTDRLLRSVWAHSPGASPAQDTAS